MAGARLPGSTCATTDPAPDTGTTALTRSPSPGSFCASHGHSLHKKSHGGTGGGSAQRLIIEKARANALDLLTKRLDDPVKWDAEMKALEATPESNAIDKLMKPLSPSGDATRKLFFGWFGTVSPVSRERI